jgi:hypothetical protein
MNLRYTVLIAALSGLVYPGDSALQAADRSQVMVSAPLRPLRV